MSAVGNWRLQRTFIASDSYCHFFTVCYRPTGIQYCSQQWRTQDFRMGGVEVLHAPRGAWRGGIPSPLREGSGERLSPENFSYFLLKILYFDAF